MSSKLRRFFKNLGPGLIIGASDDDPAGIATYSQAGAQFGLVILWTALITFPMMVAIQEMCARIGIVTARGLITNIDQNYPRPVVYLVLCLIFPAIIFNIGADISSMGAVANLLLPTIPAYVFAILFTGLLLAMMLKLSYKKIASILKYLCLTLLLYIIVPFLIKKNGREILFYTFVPHIQLNKEFLGMLVALLGTTISPYLFFWQATMEAEDERRRHLIVNNRIIKRMIVDTDFGMLFSNIIMYFIILTTGSVLYSHVGQRIETVEQAARALAPLAGKSCYLLFALGIISTGLLAIPVLSGALSYIFTSAFHYEEGLDKKFYQAKTFYGVMIVSLIIGLVINFLKINSIKALVYSAIFYGVLAPILIFIILLISNNKKIMGKYTNGAVSNIIGTVTLVLMAFASVAYLIEVLN